MQQRNKPRNKNRNLGGVTPRSAPKIATAPVVQTEGEYSVRNIVRYILDPGFCVLTAVACALVVAGLNVAAVDTNGDRPLYFYLAVGAGSLPVIWMVLRTLWSGKPDSRLVLQALTLASLMSASATLLVGAVMVSVPPTAQRIAAARRPNNDWHYYFNPDLGNPATNVLLSVGLLGFIAALLIGLLLVVFVVLPIMAVCLAVGKEFSQTQPFPTAVTQSWRVLISPGTFWIEAVWAVGALLVPVIIALIIIRVKQRPNYRARAALGVNAIGDDAKVNRSK